MTNLENGKPIRFCTLTAIVRLAAVGASLAAWWELPALAHAVAKVLG